jgi:hypothetical protein
VSTSIKLNCPEYPKVESIRRRRHGAIWRAVATDHRDPTSGLTTHRSNLIACFALAPVPMTGMVIPITQSGIV